MKKYHLKLWVLQALLITLLAIWPGALAFLQFFWLIPALILAVELPWQPLIMGGVALFALLGIELGLIGQWNWFDWLTLSGYLFLVGYSGQLARQRRWQWAQLAAAIAIFFFLWDLTVMLWNWKIWQQQLALIYKELSGQLEQISLLLANLEGRYASPVMKEEAQNILYWSVLLLPAQSLTTTLLSAWSTAYWAGRQLEKKERSLLPLPITKWQLPWYLIWLAIVGLLLLLFAPNREELKVLAASCLFLSGVFGFIDGLAFQIQLWPYMSRFYKILFILFSIIFSLYAAATLAVFGLLDLGFNWRKKLHNIDENTGGT